MSFFYFAKTQFSLKEYNRQSVTRQNIKDNECKSQTYNYTKEKNQDKN